MRHCLLITVYKSPEVCNHLLETMPEDWGAYVHIDSKSSIEPCDIYPKAVVLNEYRIYWGAVEHLKAILLMMETAWKSGIDFDYYHIISGEDYWGRHPSEFDSALHEGYSYVEVHPLPRQDWHNGGYDIIKYKTLASRGDIRKGLLSFENKVLKLWQIVSSTSRKTPSYPLYCGAVYCSLYKNAVQAVLDSSMSVDILNRLEGTCLGEELYFQTLLMNSEHKDRIINDCMRYIDWNVVPAPKFLTREDIDEVVSSGKLFCRKVERMELARELDSRLNI